MLLEAKYLHVMNGMLIELCFTTLYNFMGKNIGFFGFEQERVRRCYRVIEFLFLRHDNATDSST